jgi:acyl carrier protein
MSIANDVERDIIEYLRVHHGVEADEISDESTLSDLGLDSLGVFAIGDILQMKYGISLNDERIAGVRTFSDFKKFIFLNRAKRPKAEQSGDNSIVGRTPT